MILGGKLPGKVGRRSFFLKWPHGQEVKTSPFHGGNPGSIPGGVTIKGLHKSSPFSYLCGYGGIGRRAGFRFLWQHRAGSSPVSRTTTGRIFRGPAFFVDKTGGFAYNKKWSINMKASSGIVACRNDPNNWTAVKN